MKTSEKVEKLLDSGRSVPEIAKKVRRTPSHVYGIVRRLGRSPSPEPTPKEIAKDLMAQADKMVKKAKRILAASKVLAEALKS